MSDYNLKGFNAIKPDQTLIERTKKKIISHPQPLPTRRKRSNFPKYIMVAASLLLLIVGYQLFRPVDQSSQSNQGNQGPVMTEDGGLHIPAIELPENTDNASMDMIGLVVYQGRIYTQTSAKPDLERVDELLGEKLGTTKPSIDEWSSQDDYSEEFASSIGNQDVYSVKGYDKDFRIMSYVEHNGEVYAEFYECLNGITVYNGEDVFGKLNLSNNIEEATYQSYNDWYYSTDNYYSFENLELLQAFVEKLNEADPFDYKTVEEVAGDFRNDDSYRKLTLTLEDGTSVDLTVLKQGYVHYGYGVYFKMNDDVFQQVWDELVIE